MAAQHPETDHDTQMGQAIIRGILIGVPLSIVVLAVAMMLFAARTLGDAVAASAVPGVLIGVFFGGFVGVIRTMD